MSCHRWHSWHGPPCLGLADDVQIRNCELTHTDLFRSRGEIAFFDKWQIELTTPAIDVGQQVLRQFPGGRERRDRNFQLGGTGQHERRIAHFVAGRFLPAAWQLPADFSRRSKLDRFQQVTKFAVTISDCVGLTLQFEEP